MLICSNETEIEEQNEIKGIRFFLPAFAVAIAKGGGRSPIRARSEWDLIKTKKPASNIETGFHIRQVFSIVAPTQP